MVVAAVVVASSVVGAVGSGSSGEEAEDEGGLGLGIGVGDGVGSGGCDRQLDDGQEGESEDEVDLHVDSLQEKPVLRCVVAELSHGLSFIVPHFFF